MKNNEPFVYVPPGAKTNIENTEMKAPEVKYEKRKVRFQRREVGKVIGGKHGKDCRDIPDYPS